MQLIRNQQVVCSSHITSSKTKRESFTLSLLVLEFVCRRRTPKARSVFSLCAPKLLGSNPVRRKAMFRVTSPAPKTKERVYPSLLFLEIVIDEEHRKGNSLFSLCAPLFFALNSVRRKAMFRVTSPAPKRKGGLQNPLFFLQIVLRTKNTRKFEEFAMFAD